MWTTHVSNKTRQGSRTQQVLMEQSADNTPTKQYAYKGPTDLGQSAVQNSEDRKEAMKYIREVQKGTSGIEEEGYSKSNLKSEDYKKAREMVKQHKGEFGSGSA